MNYISLFGQRIPGICTAMNGKSKWKKIRSGWSKIIREDLGSFGLDDFRYEYEKRSPIEGVIWILKNGKRQELSFNVEIKNGIWRIPEK